MVASDVRLTRTFDETNIGRAFVIGADRRIRESFLCWSKKKFRLPGNEEKDLDIGRLSGWLASVCLAVAEPNRMMPKWYTRRYIAAHRKNRCTLCFSTHVRLYAEKSNAHAVALYLAVLYLTTHTLYGREEDEEGRERSGEGKKRGRECAWFCPFCQLCLFSSSLLSTFTSFISSTMGQGRSDRVSAAKRRVFVCFGSSTPRASNFASPIEILALFRFVAFSCSALSAASGELNFSAISCPPSATIVG